LFAADLQLIGLAGPSLRFRARHPIGVREPAAQGLESRKAC